MLSQNNKISLRQLQILIILDIFGTGVIILPRKAASFAAQDGWLVIILSTLLVMLCTVIITSVGRLFPQDTFFQYTSKILSKPFAILLSIGLVLKIILNISMELRIFGEIVNQTMLSQTPFVVLCVSMLLTSAFAASKGYETRARIAEILIVIALVPLLFVFALSASDVDFTNIQPMFTTKPSQIASGSFLSCISFTGIEFLLLVCPYLHKAQNFRKRAVSAVGLVGALLLLITVLCIAKFGADDLKKEMWPVIEIMNEVNLPGSFFERQDALIMSFWILSVFAIVNAGLFFSSVLLKDMFGKGRHSLYILVCSLFVFLISFLPKNIGDVYHILEFLFITFGIAYMFLIPLLLLVIAKIRGVGK